MEIEHYKVLVDQSQKTDLMPVRKLKMYMQNFLTNICMFFWCWVYFSQMAHTLVYGLEMVEAL